MADAPNLLFYGDNLDILRGRFQDGRPYIADESIDLIYLDPPFNSNADYNAFLPETDGTRSAAQLKAFKDTWTWAEAAPTYYAFVESPETPDRVRDAMLAFHKLVGPSSMLAYLSMMAPRLVQLRRKLKPTGSLYLHCDPTASHYLKILLDATFRPMNFKNEIIWKRSDAHSDHRQGARHFGRVHDIILFYTYDKISVMNAQFLPLPEKTVRRWYCNVEPGTGRRYNMADLSGPGGAAKKNPYFEWKGIKRYWRYSKEKLDQLDSEGKIVYRSSGMPYLKRYLDESKGVPAQDIWDDVPMVRGLKGSNERLGYPTQKPVALLERIIRASSNEGDTVLDPFCGCGTTIAAAQKLNRRWIGIDVTFAATNLIKQRLADAYKEPIAKTYKVIGEPTTVEEAAHLAAGDPYQFQWWALGLVGARPVEQKKGGDRGIDGKRIFHDDPEGGESKVVIFSIKAGQGLNPGMVRDLGHVVDREQAAIGVLLTMRDPTDGMRAEAAGAGVYRSPWGTAHPRLQILAVGDLLAGRRLDLPPSRDDRTFRKAPRVKKAGGTTGLLFGDPEG